MFPFCQESHNNTIFPGATFYDINTGIIRSGKVLIVLLIFNIFKVKKVYEVKILNFWEFVTSLISFSNAFQAVGVVGDKRAVSVVSEKPDQSVIRHESESSFDVSSSRH